MNYGRLKPFELPLRTNTRSILVATLGLPFGCGRFRRRRRRLLPTVASKAEKRARYSCTSCYCCLTESLFSAHKLQALSIQLATFVWLQSANFTLNRLCERASQPKIACLLGRTSYFAISKLGFIGRQLQLHLQLVKLRQTGHLCNANEAENKLVSAQLDFARFIAEKSGTLSIAT